jgi:oligoribonuclease (3'-5' exoribonuclease)
MLGTRARMASSGLIDKVKASTTTEQDAEEHILAFINKVRVQKRITSLRQYRSAKTADSRSNSCPNWKPICITAI